MDWQGWFTVALTVAVLATLIAIPRLTTDLVLMGALLLLSITGILEPDEALLGFANTGLMTVAAMFIVAAAIRASGGVDLARVRAIAGTGVDFISIGALTKHVHAIDLSLRIEPGSAAPPRL
mgnify:CR=1 FL=1